MMRVVHFCVRFKLLNCNSVKRTMTKVRNCAACCTALLQRKPPGRVQNYFPVSL
jgi:hypothetical protein